MLNLVTRNGKMETRAVYIEIFLVSWNLPNCPEHQGSTLRKMASSGGDQLLARDFHAIMHKILADKLSKKWNWISVFILQKYFLKKTPTIKWQFCTKVLPLSRLVSEVWAKYKDVPTKILKLHAKTNSSQQNLKFVFKQYRQTSQRMMNACKQ